MTTLAGTGAAAFNGDGIPATSAGLAYPEGLVVDGSGNVLIADNVNNRVRRVAAGTGIITTVAGNGAQSFSGDGGPATSAGLSVPHDVALDGSGNVLIADRGNHRIRRVAAGTGIITTLAGNGAAAFGGDGGPATSASLNHPHAVSLGNSGSVLIGDHYNHRIRRVAADTGIITTLAGTGAAAFGGDGGPATSASLAYPLVAALDRGGDVLIVDHFNHRIRRVAADTGIINTLAGTGAAAFGGDGGPATSASLFFPTWLALDGGGNVLIVDHYNHRIRRVAAGTGIITTLAGTGAAAFGGDGGPATSASMSMPLALALDEDGNVLISDRDNHRIRRVAAAVLPTPSPTPSPSSTPYCAPALFRALLRTDLVGALVGTALAPGLPVLAASEAACRQACCDAAACDGYAYDSVTAMLHPSAACFLYVNVSQLVPSSTMASGLRESVLL